MLLEIISLFVDISSIYFSLPKPKTDPLQKPAIPPPKQKNKKNDENPLALLIPQ